MMKIFIFFLICEVLCELPVSTVMPVLEPDEKVPSLEPETLTDLPIGAAEDFFSLTLNDEDIEIEANEVTTDAPITDPSVTITSTTTLHFLEAACDDKNMEWNTCGPRCYQTCAFQPRGVRRTRAVCETTMPTGCRPGCFCKKGYVRLNDKCVLSDDCPSKCWLSFMTSLTPCFIHSFLDSFIHL